MRLFKDHYVFHAPSILVQKSMDAQTKEKLNISQLTLAKLAQLGRDYYFCGLVTIIEYLVLNLQIDGPR